MNRLQVVAVIVLLSSVIILWLLSGVSLVDQEKTTLRFDRGYNIEVEVVDTVESRALGLSYRESLAENTGMLFEFETDAERGMWMREMNFELDVIWLSHGQIIGIEHSLPLYEAGEITKRVSPGKIDAFLEVNAGFCAERGIQVGDQVDII